MESINLALSGTLDAPLRAAAGAPAGDAVPGADAAEIGAFVAALLAQTMAPPETAVAATATTPQAFVAPALVAPTTAGRQVLAGLLQPAAAGLPLPAAPTSTEPAPLAVPTWRDLALGTAGEAADAAAGAIDLADGATPSAAPRGDALPGAAADALKILADGDDAPDATALVATADPAPAATDGGDHDSPAVQALHRIGDTAQVGSTYGGRAAAALPVNDQGLFSERLNQHISVMVGQQAQHARIAVSPPELGPVEVRVTVIGDEATIHLAATHAATREALEEALPRLRAAFADSGIALGNAGVFAEMPEQRGDPRAALPAWADTDTAPGTAAATADVAPPLRMVRLGLVDAFV
ncbi:MAG: flagellar hook-length control protein FliK [Gammaproteobacteria bacterium]